LKLKPLANDKYSVLAVIENGACPVLQFLMSGQASTKASRLGIVKLLELASQQGLDAIPTACIHEVSKSQKIYEFIKGDLRVFFFKGKNGQIAICCGSDVKKQQRANKTEVERAAKFRDEYFRALENHTLEIEKPNGTQ
jgi:hypothetical protein